MKTLMYAFLFLPALLSAQDQSGQFFKIKEAPKAVQEQMFSAIPLKNDKIFYDTIIHTDTSLTKAILFTRIKQWFTENFTDSKDVFKVDDPDNGRLSGNCIYRYKKFGVLTEEYSYLKFKVNVAVKDGKFEYQLYNFNSDVKDVPLLSNSSSGDYQNSIQFDELYKLYKDGKDQKSAKKYLTQMTNFVYFVNTTLPEVVKENNSH